jgi:tRNA uridine 5-carboxymethylaminomethyl modification enzyme
VPVGFDYAGVRGLSAELQQKLARVRPETIGQAQRIPGMTPAAISLLLVHLSRARRSESRLIRVTAAEAGSSLGLFF